MIKVGKFVTPSAEGLQKHSNWSEHRVGEVLDIDDLKVFVKWLDTKKREWVYAYRFKPIILTSPSIFKVTNKGLLLGDNKKVLFFKYEDSIEKHITPHFELSEDQFHQAIEGFDNYLNSGVEIYEKIT